MGVQQELEAVVGADGLLASGCEAYAVDGTTPQWVAIPATPEQVRDLVLTAVANDLKVAPVGGGVHAGIGAVPERIDLVISTKRLTEITYDNRKDMTIGVGAGLTLAALSDYVQESNLWLPVDLPDPDRATLGGIVAANANGPMRFDKGPLRDHVIGIRVVSPEGKLVKAGGKVVKNVAGYDMCKLYTGSLGTLGIIVEVFLKLAPKPDAVTAIRAEVDGGAKTEALMAAIMDSSLESVYMEVLSGSRAQALGDTYSGMTVLALGFHGGAAIVEWETATAKQMIAAAGFDVLDTLTGVEASTGEEALAGVYGMNAADMVLKADIVSSQVVEFMQAVDKLSKGHVAGIGCAAHAGNGIVHVFADGEGQELVLLGEGLLERASSLGGNLVVCKAPRQLKSQLKIWGKPSEAWNVMRAIRDKFDPSGVLNAGRFIEAA